MRAAPDLNHYKVPVEAREAVQSVGDIPAYLEQSRKNAELVQPLSEMIRQLQQLLSN